MNERISTYNSMKNIKIYSYMIVIIMFFSPFTSLRFFRVGVTETVALMMVILVLMNKYSIKENYMDKFIFIKFWILYLFTSVIGLSINYFFLEASNDTIRGMVFDAISYFIVFLTCMAIEIIINNKKKFDIDFILNKLFLYTSLVLFILFVVSRVTTSLFGLTLLNSSGVFMPFASNLHHVAMVVGPLPFLGMLYINSKYNASSKLLYLLLIISDNILIFNSGSDKAIAGLLLGYVVLVIYWILRKISEKNKKRLTTLIFLIVVISILMVNYEIILNVLISIFNEADDGNARSELYSIALNKSTDSLVFGFGPGFHSYSSYYEIYFDIHSTFLTALLQAGIIGFIIFSILVLELILVYRKNRYILAAFSSIFLYMLFDDILRRLPIWIFLILFYYKIKVETNNINEM